MKLVVREQDFELALGMVEVKRRFRGKKTLGSKVDRDILDELPRVLAAKFTRLLPDGFKIVEVELAVELSGKVFGCGIAGEATVRFAPDSVPRPGA